MEGEVVNTDTSIAERLNYFFANISKVVAEEIPSVNVDAMSFLRGDYVHSFFLSPATPQIVSDILHSLKNKSSHIITVPTKVLKYMSPLISGPLSVAINKSFSSSIFPGSMKQARIVPIKKPGVSTDMNNYRPISILPIISKVYEKVVHRQLYSYLCHKKILFHSQFGFQARVSRVHAIINYIQYLYDAIDQGHVVLSLFLDFREAFDSVEHNILLSNLQYYGLRGDAMEWFRSYLSNRSQYTIVGGETSEVLNTTHGISQESVLGPLLFLLCINDLPNTRELFKYIIYADHSILSVAFPPNEIEYYDGVINSELNNIDLWLSANRILLNEKKSHHIFSYRNFHRISPLYIGRNEIKPINSTKFFGIYIDRNLDFRDHVSHIPSKIA